MINSSRVWLERETRLFAEMIRPGDLLLDAGCGDSPYRHIATLAGARYESADFKQVPGAPYDAKITYVGDLANIQCQSNRFDFVLFHQVMEHLPDPSKVLGELYRVLKPGGKLLYSAPLFYEPHQLPYDFYRYTSIGAEYLLKDAGFVVDRMDWLEGYFGTVSYQMKGIARDLPLGLGGGLGNLAFPFMVALKGMMAIGAVGFGWLDTKRKYTARGYPKNYVAVATKPARERS
jgi:SAM-dependent methyltransferase